MKTVTLPFTQEKKYIVFSDCHREDGSAGDEFARNSLIYKCALEYYVYELLREFHDPDPARTRYIKIWGNHDLDWEKRADLLQALFPGIVVYEAATRRGRRRIRG